MNIRPAEPRDLPAIVALLREARLPAADLSEAAATFVVATVSGQITGAAAVEGAGPAALFRSLVVAPQFRGSGIAAALVAAAEERAHSAGVGELVLLTETAAAFFARRGYVRTARANAPPSVQASAEFRALCPASAVCMSKRLTRPTPPATGAHP